MASPLPNTFIVDDSDSRVRYSGDGWRDGGNYVREFAGTTHVTPKKGDTATVSFNGTRIAMFGSRRARADLSPVTCVLDGVTIPTSSYNDSLPRNQTHYHIEYCAAEVPDNAEHTLVVTMDEDTNTQNSFILDYFVYDVSPDMEMDVAPTDAEELSRLVVDDRDEDRVEYEGTWEQKDRGYGLAPEGYTSSFSVTNTVGSKATLNFSGRSIRVIGGSPGAPNDNSWVANFQLETRHHSDDDDDAEPTAITSVTSRRQSSEVATTIPFAHQVLYLSPNLPNGDHTLTIEYIDGERDLALNYFVYDAPITETEMEIGPEGGGDSLVGNRPDGSGDAIEEEAQEGASRTGMIAGIAVGVVVVVLALIIALLVWRRKKASKRRADQEKSGQSIPPNPFLVEPYTPPDGTRPQSPGHRRFIVSSPPRGTTPPKNVDQSWRPSGSTGNLHTHTGSSSRSETPTGAEAGSIFASSGSSTSRMVHVDGGVSLAREAPPPYRKR